MTLPAIQEIIIVEGRDDIAAVKLAVSAQVIATGGFAITPQTWALIKRAAQAKGVVVLTDPDTAGRQIRERIASFLQKAGVTCKHAFVSQENARRASDGDLGIEYASPAAILSALRAARCEQETPTAPLFSVQDLIDAHLSGHPNASARRASLCATLGLGAPNARQLLARLNHYGISRTEFLTALAALPAASSGTPLTQGA